jgi:dephospho-CoA kinase
MFSGKPIIGITGGIGAGKTFVARLFGELGCRVIVSDEQVHRAYARDDVKAALRAWWGDRAFTAAGEVDRKAVARIVFADPAERRRLEGLIHPIVNAQRAEIMAADAGDPSIRAFVWDVPLLFEANLHHQCDRIVFVDAPVAVRLNRIRSRGWTEAELVARENSQFPLDKKRSMSHYCVSNVDGVDVVREQARDVLSRILAGDPTSAAGDPRPAE